jgi:hypothetical protein
MEYSRFLLITLTLEKKQREISSLYKNHKIDIYDVLDPYHQIVTEMIREIYGEEGEDWYSWFCYESDFGKKDWSGKKIYATDSETGKLKELDKQDIHGAIDENGNPICYSYESTWKFLEENHSRIPSYKLGDKVVIDLYGEGEIFKVVGIRETELELQGDWSGGTHNTHGSSWYPIEKIKKTQSKK